MSRRVIITRIFIFGLRKQRARDKSNARQAAMDGANGTYACTATTVDAAATPNRGRVRTRTGPYS